MIIDVSIFLLCWAFKNVAGNRFTKLWFHSASRSGRRFSFIYSRSCNARWAAAFSPLHARAWRAISTSEMYDGIWPR